MLLPGMVTRNEMRTAINRHPYSDFDSGTSQQYFGVNFRWHYGPVYFHVLFVLIVLPYVFQTGNLTQQNR